MCQQVEETDTIKFSLDKQSVEILSAKSEDAGKWTCIAENDAGSNELDIILDVWGM